MADPTREVYAFVGDGTYLLMPSEIATAVQEGIKIVVVLVDNGGFASHWQPEPFVGHGRFWHPLSPSWSRRTT